MANSMKMKVVPKESINIRRNNPFFEYNFEAGVETEIFKEHYKYVKHALKDVDKKKKDK